MYLAHNRKKGKLIRVLGKLSQSRVTGQTPTELKQLLDSDVIEPDLLRLYVLSKNKVNKSAFALTPYADRVLLLPQCLRASGCQAPLDANGYHCVSCGRCIIKEVKEEAEALGYKVFILPGGSIVEKIFDSTKPKACLGVACLKELVLGCLVSERKNVIPYAVPLTREGCLNTDVDIDELKVAMGLFNHTSIQIPTKP